METNRDVLGLLQEMTGFNLGELFDMMDVVEQEIAKAKEIYPSRALYIENSFLMFGNETGLFSGKSLELWRAHVRELLSRVGNPPSRKEDREMGTYAEAMVAFSEASFKAPLNQDGTAAYAYVFAKVFGQEILEKYVGKFDVNLSETWRGAVEEMVIYARKGMSRPRDYPTDEYMEKIFNEALRDGNESIPLPTFQVSLGV